MAEAQNAMLSPHCCGGSLDHGDLGHGDLGHATLINAQTYAKRTQAKPKRTTRIRPLTSLRRRLRNSTLLGLLPAAMLALPAQADECAVFEDLMTLTSVSEDFLGYLQNGYAPDAAETMQRVLKSTSRRELHSGLRAGDMVELKRGTDGLLAQQQTLVQIDAREGREAALRTSQQLNADRTVQSFRQSLTLTPCHNADQLRDVTNVVGPLPPLGQISSGYAAIGAVVASAFAALAFLLVERRMRAKAERRKRHACALECEIFHDSRGSDALVLDISQEGATVHSDAACEVGDTIELALPEGLKPARLTGRVDWANTKHIGVRFRSRLNAAEVATVAEAGRIDDPEADLYHDPTPESRAAKAAAEADPAVAKLPPRAAAAEKQVRT